MYTRRLYKPIVSSVSELLQKNEEMYRERLHRKIKNYVALSLDTFCYAKHSRRSDYKDFFRTKSVVPLDRVRVKIRSDSYIKIMGTRSHVGEGDAP